MRKKVIIILLAVSICNVIVYGCLIDPKDIPSDERPCYIDSADTAFTGIASGSAWGYKSDITVVIKLEGGEIKKVAITHGDDREYADKAVAQAKELILATNSFNINAITGATYTRNGIKKAGEQALELKGLHDRVKYAITKGDSTNGDFTIKPTKASAGATITLTPTAKSGYQFMSWSFAQL